MKASKGNKVYTIDEMQKEYYLAQGYDISDDKGNITDYGSGKTISYQEYKNLEEKYDKLEKKCSEIEKENKKLKKEMEGSELIPKK